MFPSQSCRDQAWPSISIDCVSRLFPKLGGTCSISENKCSQKLQFCCPCHGRHITDDIIGGNGTFFPGGFEAVVEFTGDFSA